MSNQNTVKYYGVMPESQLKLRFARRLREWRAKRKLTQQQLAERAGVDYKYIQRIEGKKPPAVRIDMIERLAKALRVQPSSLLE